MNLLSTPVLLLLLMLLMLPLQSLHTLLKQLQLLLLKLLSLNSLHGLNLLHVARPKQNLAVAHCQHEARLACKRHPGTLPAPHHKVTLCLPFSDQS